MNKGCVCGERESVHVIMKANKSKIGRVGQWARDPVKSQFKSKGHLLAAFRVQGRSVFIL